MVETTSFPTDHPIGTSGTVGRGNIDAIVLPIVDKNGNTSRRWVTYKMIERLGLEDVPVGEAVVLVGRLDHNVATGNDDEKKEAAVEATVTQAQEVMRI